MKSKKALAWLLTAGMAVSLFAGCNTTTTDNTVETTAPVSVETEAPTEEQTEAPTDEITGYSEAPMLAEQVAAGTLEAVEDRIPDLDNVLIQTTDASGAALSIGNYGGNLNLGSADGSWGLARIALESIIRYNTDGTYSPNVIKSYEYSDDYTVWTFHLREGMKWSDGDDFTADDITFWYYMIHVNNYDSKASWTALKDNETGNFAVLTKVDEYTVTWTFDTAKFPQDFIENGDFKWCWAPSHYLADLIPSSYYVENEYWEDTGLSDEQVLANALAKGIEQSTVKDLGKQACYYFWNISGIPTLNSFVLSTNPDNNARDKALCIMERNAYYWKVDAEGNQLPYLDAVYFNTASEDSTTELEFISGNIDVYGVDMSAISTLMEQRDDAVLKVYAGSDWGSYQITFNQTCKDEKYQAVFSNIDFRHAISICVDREEVSELLHDGFLEAAQCAPAEGNVGYSEEYATKWTEYDTATAATLFESAGLVMGSDGYYDFADGTDFELTIYMYEGSCSDDTYPVITKYFEAAGIKCAQKVLTVEAYDQEIDNNDWYCSLCPHTPVSGISLKSRVAPFVPTAQAAEWYGEYGTYYGTNGESGIAPEADSDMAKLYELYTEWTATPDNDERESIQAEIYEVLMDNMWTVAYLECAGNYVLISGDLMNWADDLIWDDLYQYTNMVHYESLYFAE